MEVGRIVLPDPRVVMCVHCRNDDPKLLEQLAFGYWFCGVCARAFKVLYAR